MCSMGLGGGGSVEWVRVSEGVLYGAGSVRGGGVEWGRVSMGEGAQKRRDCALVKCGNTTRV